MGILDGKVAVITGATSGIGLRSAELFTAEGAKLALAGRRVEAGTAIAARLGANCIFVPADVSREEDVIRLIDETVSRFGRLDVMFNNAGIPGRMLSIQDTAVADIDTILAVHVRGVMLGMNHAARAMQSAGSIINTASLAGSRTGFSSHAYCAAKAAVIHLTRCVAVELGGKGIRANSLSPGPVVTEIFGAAIPGKSHGPDVSHTELLAERLSARFAELQPIRRACLPEDVAQAALFLASDASAFINGHDLVVDGGNVGGALWPVAVARIQEVARLFAPA
jgi:NAD(P)-dependent dehydrogenase (short-subunit alcohol dehydrogenase family)